MDEDLKAKLLSPREQTPSGMPEDDVETPLGTVRVRGLSRKEVLKLEKLRSAGVIKDTETWEQKIVALGMVDPQMTEDETKLWQENSPAGELMDVTDKISELSGLSDDADKSGVSGVRDDSGSGVRVLPGDETAHDGGSTSGADEQ